MKTIKVSEATPIQLDWLVAKCSGDFSLYHNLEEGQRFLNLWTGSAFLHYSSNWANGGPIIEKEKITLKPNGPIWVAYAKGKLVDIVYPMEGPTPLIAAMRCYCCAKLGDEIDIPEELQPCQQPNL